MKSTEELEHEIQRSETPAALAGEEFDMPPLATHLNSLLHSRGLTVQDVIVGCNLDRSYGYQLFNGTRKPTRNFLLRLAFLLRLSEAEVQRLLKIAERQPLYARNRRDAAVLYGLTHDLTAEQTDALLHSLGEEGLV
ncbi:MAG: helix-turn-helix domain-containing protein [Oscillospiraceae bacterium]